jgi:hypothetical protein
MTRRLPPLVGGKAVRAALVAGADKRASVAKTIEARGEGVTSANGFAKALNDRSRGSKWTARSVLNLVAQLS